MPVTPNDDNGSLFTGDQRLDAGELVRIAGEGKVRRVTYVMGSAKKGWRACFKGQGALPVGAVEWEIGHGEASAEHQPEPARRTPRARAATAPSGPTAPARPVEIAPIRHDKATSVVFSGYDSAWTRTNLGAIASIRLRDGVLILVGPDTAGFGEALSLLEEHATGTAARVIAVDQPLIVPNLSGRRPVDGAIAPSIARRGGGVQPANRGRQGMFDDGAPIWSFLACLACLEGDLNPTGAIGTASGNHIIEVFPAAATLGLFPEFHERRRLPKYNPARGTFLLDDWRALCRGLGALCDALAVAGGESWCGWAAGLDKPRKVDQDRLDALICALCAYVWWGRGRDASMVLGDLRTGYMVVPTHPALSEEVARDAHGRGVPVSTPGCSDRLANYQVTAHTCECPAAAFGGPVC